MIFVLRVSNDLIIDFTYKLFSGGMCSMVTMVTLFCFVFSKLMSVHFLFEFTIKPNSAWHKLGEGRRPLDLDDLRKARVQSSDKGRISQGIWLTHPFIFSTSIITEYCSVNTAGSLEVRDSSATASRSPAEL